ncbi:MAG: class I SAM-dependent methyltransferase [Thermoflexibacter sp.]|nr:class I SAM-dependent methyltransferase [Thermoflexibacter sp.]
MILLKKIIKSLINKIGYDINRYHPPITPPPPPPNPHIHLSAWDYQKKWVEPFLKNSNTILDIGSGNYPSPVANILADFFPDNTIHRSGKLKEDKPTVICSVERLPFLHKSIDFVICSHIFEHINSPQRAGEEVGRIAHRGYIETPAYGKDILIGSGYLHEWQVVAFQDTLHFFAYSERQKQAHVKSPVMDIWVQPEYHQWQDFFWERQDLFNACLLWEDKPQIIEYRNMNNVLKPLSKWVPVPEEYMIKESPALNSSEITLLEKCLATPDGLSSLKYEDGVFVNKTKDIFYPVRGKRIYCEIAYMYQ